LICCYSFSGAASTGTRASFATATAAGAWSIPCNIVRRRHRITGDGAGYYLRRTMPRPVELAGYNDECARFIELQALIVLARRMAEAAKASRR
jgi:hypothetical protein